ncbi:MAG: primosomal protein N' [Elusimicrobiota bacterium]|nr:primosomal protein N' [Elusimicrobiota bacterium]
MYIEVALPISVDREFSYIVPEELKPAISVGRRVLVHFKNKKQKGYVVKITEECKVKNPKEVLKVLDGVSVITDKLFELARWLSSYYVCSLGEALNCIFPVDITPTAEKYQFDSVQKIDNLSMPEFSVESITPHHLWGAGKLKKALKNTLQKNIYVLTELDRNIRLNFYHDLILDALKHGECILLLPEISSAEETAKKFYKIFGNCIGIWHSKITNNEKYNTWLGVISGRIKIAFGTRSAIFLPFRNLKLIIIDDEYNESYKNPQKPFYDTITVSERLAKIQNCTVLLGSKLMSLTTYFRLRNKDYDRIRFSKSLRRKLPTIKIIQIESNKFPISNFFRSELEKRVLRNELSVVFVSRRGYSPTIICSNCGFIFRCPKCGIPLVYHRSQALFRCHYCNFSQQYPSKCSLCNNTNLKFVGRGTERVEQILEKLFSGIKILRIDKDVIKSEEDIENCIKSIITHRVNIIVGTQFLLPVLHKLTTKISFVGIYNIDNLLYMSDFRSTERAFKTIFDFCSLISNTGTILIQTHNRKHYIFKFIEGGGCRKGFNWKKFYDEELKFRSELFYPPVNTILNLVLRGKDRAKTKQEAEILTKFIQDAKISNLIVLGPDEPPHPQLRANFRQHILLKLTNSDNITQISNLLKSFQVKDGLHLSIDINPWEIF